MALALKADHFAQGKRKPGTMVPLASGAGAFRLVGAGDQDVARHRLRIASSIQHGIALDQTPTPSTLENNRPGWIPIAREGAVNTITARYDRKLTGSQCALVRGAYTKVLEDHTHARLVSQAATICSAAR
jgi:hypothetical protein